MLRATFRPYKNVFDHALIDNSQRIILASFNPLVQAPRRFRRHFGPQLIPAPPRQSNHSEIPPSLWGWRVEPRSSKATAHPLLKLSKLTPPKID